MKASIDTPCFRRHGVTGPTHRRSSERSTGARFNDEADASEEDAMRRMLRGSLVPLALSALLLSACSGGSDSTTQASSTPKAGEKVELNYWSWAPDMDKTVQVWNDSHPDIHVTVNKQDGGDPAVTKLLTAIKAGSGAPAVMQAEYQKIPTLVWANAVADISKESNGLKAKFPDSAWNAMTLGS